MRFRFTFFAIFTALQIAIGQSYIPSISTFTTENGLSSNEVLAIHKDSRGFMWIGTQYGLNRFDGQEFKSYTRENTPDLKFDIVNDIMEDDKGNLWLVKSKEKYQHIFHTIAINLFNIYSGKIQTLEEYFGTELPFKTEDITFIQQLADASIFIHCNQIEKSFRYLPETGFQSVSIPSIFIQIADIRLKPDQLLISGHTKKDHAYCEINWKGELLNIGHGGMPWIIKDDQKRRELETWGYYNLDAFDYFSPKSTELKRKINGDESSIYQTQYNAALDLFWLREQSRISAVTPTGQQVFTRPCHEEDYEKIPFFMDGATTWYSDKKEGLIAITLKPNHFQTYQFFENPIDNSMRGITKDATGTLWFSAMKGMGKMNSEGQVSIIIKGDGFTNFLNDQQNNIWGIWNNKLIKTNPNSLQQTTFDITARSYLWSIFEVAKDEIWLGCGYYSFYAINPSTLEYTTKVNFPLDGRNLFTIYHFQKRDQETVWVCTNQGLFVVNLQGEILAKYHDQQTDEFYFPAKDFRHIYAQENEIWIATGDAGLFKLKNEAAPGEINNAISQPGQLIIEKQYTASSGLSSNSLHAVYADQFDYLWISSDHGLMQLDRRDGQIFKYFKANGIQHNEFNRIAHHQDENGSIYFGGLYGITSFHPKNFSNRRNEVSPPQLEITFFEQFSGDEQAFKNLTSELLTTNQIILQPSDRIFKLKLSLLDFKNSALAQPGAINGNYQYRIKGLYEWQNTQNNEFNISGLPYGKHTLEIKAENQNRLAAANQLAIDIKVLRPFYLQWWFIILGLFGIGGIAYLFLQRRTQQLLVHQEAQQLKELDSLKSRFFANISHELRTPLTLIGLPLEHLIKNYDQFSKKEAIQYLEAAKSNKDDLNRLVNEILDLSKLEAGKLQLNKADIQLTEFISRTVNVFGSSMSTKNIQFLHHATLPKVLKANIDVSKLEMVINNLISNALKFTPENGAITITTSLNDKNELSFKIEDNGRGIPTEDLKHVFQRYFQTNQKVAQLEGGSGIGLAICKEFIELMQGKIWVESIWNKGSTFTFVLPLEILDQSAAQVESTVNTVAPAPLPASSSEQAFSSEKKTVLIVEDHPELRQHLQTILSAAYNTLTAANGEEALQILEKNSSPKARQASLILSDVMMPKMDGFTFLEKVKAHEKYCSIPFILLTARAATRDKLKGLRIGVDAYMTKPFEIEELLLRVKNLLANAQNRVAVETSIEPAENKEPIEIQQAEINLQPSKKDLDWLNQIEVIALREIQNKNFVMEDISKELLISYSSFRQKIKRITGLSPNRYIRSIRLFQAKLILENREVGSIKEVALAVGFDGLTHFSKIFAEEFGKRPQEYLQSHKENIR